VIGEAEVTYKSLLERCPHRATGVQESPEGRMDCTLEEISADS
jgi:hypothetical protein